MMNLSIRPLAAAVGLALISVSAHAALVAPSQGTAVPGNTGLYLEAWNASSGATELVNLSYAYTDIASSNLSNLNTASGPAWTSATNPSTGSGTVEQLNFGTIGNVSAGFTNYTVVSAADATHTGITHIEGVTIGSSSSPAGINSTTGLTPVVQNIQSEIADWASQTAASGTFFDPNGSSTAAALNPPSSSGGWNNGNIAPGTVGSALSFYNIIGNTFVTAADGLAAHATATTAYNGFWFLSSSGQLTYNIVAGNTAPVPLPAAVWLLGSGLLGLIGVGRRSRAAA